MVLHLDRLRVWEVTVRVWGKPSLSLQDNALQSPLQPGENCLVARSNHNKGNFSSMKSASVGKYPSFTEIHSCWEAKSLFHMEWDKVWRENSCRTPPGLHGRPWAAGKLFDLSMCSISSFSGVQDNVMATGNVPMSSPYTSLHLDSKYTSTVTQNFYPFLPRPSVPASFCFLKLSRN